MRNHHATFQDADANGREVNDTIEDMIETDVRERGVADRRPYPLIARGIEVCYGQMFIGCIAPVMATYLLVGEVCSRLSEAVAKRLCQHMEIGVIRIELLYAPVYRCGKDSELISLPLAHRADKVGDTEIGSVGRYVMLLAQTRKVHLRLIVPVNDNVIATGIGFTDLIAATRHILLFVQCLKQRLSIMIQPTPLFDLSWGMWVGASA